MIFISLLRTKVFTKLINVEGGYGAIMKSDFSKNQTHFRRFEDNNFTYNILKNFFWSSTYT